MFGHSRLPPEVRNCQPESAEDVSFSEAGPASSKEYLVSPGVGEGACAPDD